jgi:hypothetical protein
MHSKLEKGVAKVLGYRSTPFMPSDFILAEAMGMELPRHCTACQNGKESQFCMDSLSFKDKKSSTNSRQSMPRHE